MTYLPSIELESTHKVKYFSAHLVVRPSSNEQKSLDFILDLLQHIPDNNISGNHKENNKNT